MSNDNGQWRPPARSEQNEPVEVFTDERYLPPAVAHPSPQQMEARRRRSLVTAVVLFVLTLLSTLAVGAQFAAAYANNQAPTFDDFFSSYFTVLTQPRLLLAGVPFAFTLIGILLAHELGHFFACRYYSISASYPYFIPAPTLIGTLGAFIRIRSPIINRKALFDIGLAGPVVGFLFAVPALAIAIAHSKVIPVAPSDAAVVFGEPWLSRLLLAWLRPGVSPADILLHPVGRAAWVGLFATGLNLLPAGQFDGGHILYALASRRHRLVSLCVAAVLLCLGLTGILHPNTGFWPGWLMWAALILLLGFRHPPLLDRREPLDRNRWLWAGVALLIFLLCFMPVPINTPSS